MSQSSLISGFLVNVLRLFFVVVCFLYAACNRTSKSDLPKILIETPSSNKKFFSGSSITIIGSISCEATISSYQISLVNEENLVVVSPAIFETKSSQVEINYDLALPEFLQAGSYFLKVKAFNKEVSSSEFVEVKIEKGGNDEDAVYITSLSNGTLKLFRTDDALSGDSVVFETTAQNINGVGISSNGGYYFAAIDNSLLRYDLLTFTEQELHPKTSNLSQQIQFAKMRADFMLGFYNGQVEVYSNDQIKLSQFISKIPVDCSFAQDNYFILGKDAFGANSTLFQMSIASNAQFATFNINHQVLAIDAIDNNLVAMLWLNLDSTLELATLNAANNEITSSKSWPKGQISNWTDLGGNGIAIQVVDEIWVFNPNNHYLPQFLTSVPSSVVKLDYNNKKGAIVAITPSMVYLINKSTGSTESYSFINAVGLDFGLKL